MDKARELLSKDAFAKHNGIELVEIGPGMAKAVITVGKEHFNSVGIVASGLSFKGN